RPQLVPLQLDRSHVRRNSAAAGYWPSVSRQIEKLFDLAIIRLLLQITPKKNALRLGSIEWRLPKRGSDDPIDPDTAENVHLSVDAQTKLRPEIRIRFDL
ncbi:MAG TPA: hypothetical protein VH088_07245, partial [Terriglobales bacterium]|nr:hypothetical protein [Terriglobales bacterium]